MLTNQKHEILGSIERYVESTGSQSAVANMTGASSATISHMIARKWDKISDEMWRQVGGALGWKADGWQLVDTTTSRWFASAYEASKEQSMWLCITANASAGKTASAVAYRTANASRGVYLLRAQELAPRAFMEELCVATGIKAGRKDTRHTLLKKVVRFFKERADLKPLLIIDEGDKLTHGAMRMLIPLYNQLEDELAVVMQATKNLERQFNIGADWHRKGIEEVRSRFGDAYLHPPGNKKADVEAICRANGLTDAQAIARVWDGLEKDYETTTTPAGQRRRVVRVRKMRRVKHLTKRELLTLSTPLIHA
jgi:hypothetical protein